METLNQQSPIIEWSEAGRALPGESVSGDRAVVAHFELGALVAVIDGLGHGDNAARAAEAAAVTFEDGPDRPIVDIVSQAHRDLRRTRGAAVSVASIDGRSDTITWLGVGNVEGVVFRFDRGRPPNRESLVLRNGVVGFRLPSLRATSLRVTPGDLLILASDGIATAFCREAPVHRVCRDVAREIFDRHARPTDDALVLAVRYLGAAP